jgi:hypothetical protein
MSLLDLKPITTNLDRRQLATLKKIARDRRMTLSACIRDFLERGLHDWQRDEARRASERDGVA